MTNQSNTAVVPGSVPTMTGHPLLGNKKSAAASDVALLNLSRTSRARVSRAVGRKRKAVSPQSPPSPNQESAVNSRTGKVALGPWLGPYDTQTESLLTSPLFTDRTGNVYVASRPGEVPTLRTQHSGGTLPNAHNASNPSAATQQLSALLAKGGLVGAAGGKGLKREQPYSVWQQASKQSTGRCGNNVRSIQQPRRS